MRPLEQLKSILTSRYTSEDGDDYKIELLPGMTSDEIQKFKLSLPNQIIPSEIEELLSFARGFEFHGLEEVRFDLYGAFGFEEMFLHSIQLAGDGYGNFWIVDLDKKGNWGPVYYICHDPAVLVKHSDNISEFIRHVDEFGRLGNESHLDIVHEKTVMEIWETKIGLMEQYDKDPQFPSNFNQQLPERFMIADLTNASINTGFAWGKYGANSKIIRFEDQPIWVIEKKVKRGLLEKIFSGKW